MTLVDGVPGVATDLATDLDRTDATTLLDRQAEILELLAAGADLSTVLDRVVVALESLIEGCVCSILLLDVDAAALRHGAAPSLPAEYTAAIDGIRIGPSAGSCGTAAHTGEPVVAIDIRDDPRWTDFRGYALPHGLRSCWSTPIRGRRGVVGTFAVYHRHPHRPEPREQRLVERFSHLASVAIDHADLYGALAESEERFRRAFEANPIGMAICDGSGRITWVNRALATVLDRPESALTDLLLAGFIGRPRDGSEGLDDLVGRPSGAVQFEALVTRPAGRDPVRVGVLASVIPAPEGRAVRWSVTVVDLSSREAADLERRARREAELARGAAESASRAKSAFVSALSHELRTPLQAITGFTELLGTLALEPSQRADALAHIQGATDHILGLVDDSLDLARIEAGALPLSPVDVGVLEISSDVLALLAPLADGLHVRLVQDGTDGRAHVDPRRLRQVLINLMTNAIRYNRPGGRVALRVRTDTDTHTVAIAIEDTGRGIPADQIETLFVPFTRFPDEPGEDGVGLGMGLTKGLTEAMGGRIEVSSAVGTGTTVVVFLPAAPGDGPLEG